MAMPMTVTTTTLYEVNSHKCCSDLKCSECPCCHDAGFCDEESCEYCMDSRREIEDIQFDIDVNMGKFTREDYI